MSERQKTTVYLDAAAYARLKALARHEGQPPAELIRRAIEEYTRRHAKPRRPRSIGMGASGRGDISERVDEYLEGFGE